MSRTSTRSAANKPFLALTTGDPAGVGPWVVAAAALDEALRRRCRPLIVGDAWVLHRHVRTKAEVLPLTGLQDYDDRPGVLNVLHTPHPGIHELTLGAPSRLSGESAAMAVMAAVHLAMIGRAAAVVTGPLSKESLKMAKIPFPGHTEWLQALTGADRVEMLMTAGPLKALLATRHIPLRQVGDALSVDNLVRAVTLTDRFIARALRRAPRWLMCGLNPHAGDNGLLGHEEKRVIIPAAAKLRRAGLHVEGPLPADVAWARHAQGTADACVCLYHDQGMIPLKTLHPKKVVNVTVGLPFVRTSPGHGTAFDLARTRRPFSTADPSATIEAAHHALDYCGHPTHAA